MALNNNRTTRTSLVGLEDRLPALRERFWAKVDRSGECWTWTASVGLRYGRFAVRRGELVQAHRFSYLLAHGSIGEGLYVCHHCDNMVCVRPDHLFVGTPRDNTLDAVIKGRLRPTGPTSERSYHVKLTADAVRTIRFRHAAGESCQMLADAYGVTVSNIRFILTGHTWKAVVMPPAWRFQARDGERRREANATRAKRPLIRPTSADMMARPAFADRFWSYVDKDGECWEWRGRRSASGYGQTRVGDRHGQVHRVSYALTYGPVLDGLKVGQHCGNLGCVRPDHLFLSTASDMALRRNARGHGTRGRHIASSPGRSQPGERHPSAKLRAIDVVAIRAACAVGTTVRQLSAQFGVSIQTIYGIRHGRRWRCLPIEEM